VEQWLGAAGIRVIRTPAHAPNCNAYAERLVRSVKEECLNRVVPLGERHLRQTLQEFVTHYRAVFRDILDFCARVLVTHETEGDRRAASLISDTGLLSLSRGPRAVRFSVRSPSNPGAHLN